MKDKVDGGRKKLSLSSGGKLTLKNSIAANKSPNSISANSRASRGTVQVEVKRTKRLSNRPNIHENTSHENVSVWHRVSLENPSPRGKSRKCE